MTDPTLETTISNTLASKKKLLIIGGLMAAIGIALLSAGGYLMLSGGDSGPADELVVDLGDEDSGVTITEYIRPADLPASATPLPTLGPPPLGDSGYSMIIEKIGVNAAVQAYGLDKNAVPIVPTGSDAAGVVAWYDFSAKPGQGSNAVFAGHVTWYGRGVFYDLDKLEKGDLIKLKGSDGTEVVYSVSASFDVNPDDPDSLKVMSHTLTDVITIITCSGKFSYNNDPVFGGEYSSRRIVRAELVSVTHPVAAAGG